MEKLFSLSDLMYKQLQICTKHTHNIFFYAGLSAAAFRGYSQKTDTPTTFSDEETEEGFPLPFPSLSKESLHPSPVHHRARLEPDTWHEIIYGSLNLILLIHISAFFRSLSLFWRSKEWTNVSVTYSSLLTRVTFFPVLPKGNKFKSQRQD